VSSCLPADAAPSALARQNSFATAGVAGGIGSAAADYVGRSAELSLDLHVGAGRGTLWYADNFEERQQRRLRGFTNLSIRCGLSLLELVHVLVPQTHRTAKHGDRAGRRDCLRSPVRVVAPAAELPDCGACPESDFRSNGVLVLPGRWSGPA